MVASEQQKQSGAAAGLATDRARQERLLCLLILQVASLFPMMPPRYGDILIKQNRKTATNRRTP